MAKIQTNWFKVETGDIVSIRYKSGTTNKTLTHTVLVLSPKYPLVTKKGRVTKAFHERFYKLIECIGKNDHLKFGT